MQNIGSISNIRLDFGWNRLARIVPKICMSMIAEVSRGPREMNEYTRKFGVGPRLKFSTPIVREGSHDPGAREIQDICSR